MKHCPFASCSACRASTRLSLFQHYSSATVVLHKPYRVNKHCYGLYGHYGTLQYLCSATVDLHRRPRFCWCGSSDHLIIFLHVLPAPPLSYWESSASELLSTCNFLTLQKLLSEVSSFRYSPLGLTSLTLRTLMIIPFKSRIAKYMYVKTKTPKK